MEPASVDDRPTTAITAAQVEFFRTFGFVKLPGFFAGEVERIDRGFEEVFATSTTSMSLDAENSYHRARVEEYEHDLRHIIPGFIDQSDDLRWIRDDPRVLSLVHALIGPDIDYAESDGNLFNCDVYWHMDAYGADITAREYLKLYVYLDPLTAETGALRVIPGSEDLTSRYAQRVNGHLLDPATVEERLGVPLDQVPHWALEVEPGDLIAGNFRTLHASFGGRPRRRLFTVNFAQAA